MVCLLGKDRLRDGGYGRSGEKKSQILTHFSWEVEWVRTVTRNLVGVIVREAEDEVLKQKMDFLVVRTLFNRRGRRESGSGEGGERWGGAGVGVGGRKGLTLQAPRKIKNLKN